MMEIPIHKGPNYLLLPDMMLENIPVNQAVAFLIGYCAYAGRADMPLRISKIEGDEIISLNTQHRTVAECLNLLAQMSGCVWSINPNGLFYFVKSQVTQQTSNTMPLFLELVKRYYYSTRATGASVAYSFFNSLRLAIRCLQDNTVEP